ncbi:hypothetical protein CYMTET_6621 [Cymbomonas tetramitiformis]|uniref:GST N-terminal domain-containing protein n=1 Tax=Cymbomonas tetramitiformis TaxID=36881 RepID=A0AAE0LHQ0_9CHLO|nr:hypothetical protein CYMTET_6621 [Cymbomonas tetramitiformis]|eukprot:gene10411-12311_t
MPLEDGTNGEREDIATPLPADWTASSLNDVVLYGTHASPPCFKIRALLNLAGVKYERSFGKSSGSYRKFPVLFVNGRQINDSYIITKTLAPILFGQPLTPADIELEETITFGLMLACEREAFGDEECLKQWASVAGLTGLTGLLIRNLAPLSYGKEAAARLSKRYPNLRQPGEYCLELQRILDVRGTPFFAGTRPGAIDASAYGALCAWASGGENTMPFAKQALTKSGLDAWYERAGKEIPNVFDLQGWWPFYT